MQPGLYPIRGMKMDRSGPWSLTSAAGEEPGPFGITGARVASAANDAWLRFTSVEGTFDWVDVAFLTGPQQGTAAVSVDGDVKLVPTRSAATAQTSIRIAAKAREIMIRPAGDGAISILSAASGVQTPGILYSNLGLPGATVGTIDTWNADIAASDFQKLNPDLIVFEYGTREGFIDLLDMTQYEGRLKSGVDRIKKLGAARVNCDHRTAGCGAPSRLCQFGRSTGVSVAQRAGNGRVWPDARPQRRKAGALACAAASRRRAPRVEAASRRKRSLFLGLGQIYGRPLLYPRMDEFEARPCRARSYDPHRGRRGSLSTRPFCRAYGRISKPTSARSRRRNAFPSLRPSTPKYSQEKEAAENATS